MKGAYRKQTCEKILDTVVEASQQSQITKMHTCRHTAVVAEGTHHKSMIDVTALPIYIKMNPSKICASRLMTNWYLLDRVAFVGWSFFITLLLIARKIHLLHGLYEGTQRGWTPTAETHSSDKSIIKKQYAKDVYLGNMACDDSLSVSLK